jgi:serine/threonine protein kinase/tetratricopeptide (TPR) repeat protein
MTEAISLGPFELEETIGAGGMGEIWRARHVDEGELVAVKIMTRVESREDAYQEIFRNEVRSVAALDHPGIIQIFDHGEVTAESAESSDGRLLQGSPYFVMEYAHRGSLERYLRGLDWPRTRYIIFAMLDALAHAHARGVIHRDLKPANVLVGCEGRDNLGLKLADFGLAREMHVENRTDRVEKGWGTPIYMAPEQFRGRWRNYGPPTDLYALGCMVWEMVTGDVPFHSRNVLVLGRKHIEMPLPDFEPRTSVPDGLEGWIRRLLVKDHRERFQFAADAAWGLLKLDSELAFEEGVERLRGTPGMLEASRLPTMIDDGSDVPPAERMEGGPQSTTLLLDYPGPGGGKPNTVSLNVDAWTENPLDGTQRESGSSGAEPSDREPPPIPDSWRAEDEPEQSQLVGAGLGLFGLRHVRIVDRDDERDRLWALLQDVESFHEARCVLLKGPAGTGKSRLASWITERAMELGAARTLRAVHSPISGPLDGLPGMLLRHFHCVGLDAEATCERIADELQSYGVREPYEWAALTELALPEHPSGPLNSDLRKTRVRFATNQQRYAALRRLVERLARERPLIVWLDDVQWGADSLGFVEHMLDIQSATRTPVLFVLTAREESLGGQPVERSLVKRLLASEYSRRLKVDALTHRDTRTLLRRLLRLDDDLAAQVERRADGNPLFAVQLVDDWVSDGKLRVGDEGFELRPGASVSVPADIFELWRDRVAGIRAAGNRADFVALLAAATLGQEVEGREWTRVCERLGLDVATRLDDELYRRGLASHIEGGWMFVHGLLRETLQEMAKKEKIWARLNRACADSLAEIYGPNNRQTARRRAEHLLEAEEYTRAIAPLLEAARLESERAEFAAALETLRRRAELLDELGAADDSEARVRGWILRSEIHVLRGEFSEALNWADRARQTARAGGLEQALDDALRVEGVVERHLGHYQKAQALLEESIERAVDTSDIRAEGLSSLELARVQERRGRWGAARELLARATDLLEQAGETFGLARCLNALGDIARQTGELDDARAFTRRAQENFEQEGMRVGVADCVNDMAEIAVMDGDLDRAEALCRQALQLYESLGSARSMRVRLTLGFALQAQDRWDEADTLLQRAHDFFEEADASLALARTKALLLAGYAHRGERNALVRLVDDFEAVLPESARLSTQELQRLRDALQHCEERQWADECKRLEQCLDALERDDG